MLCECFANRRAIKAIAVTERLSFDPIHDLPAFANRSIMRQSAVQCGCQNPPSPDAILVNWLKTNDLIHGKSK